MKDIAPPVITVIVAAYNYLNSLQLCLLSLERQSFKDFEVIIADDGSKDDLVDWLTHYKKYKAGFPIDHLWQEDKGFRKCKLLNRSILRSKGSYLVFIDADCVLEKDFLLTHWNYRQEGDFLGGRRTMISQSLAETITAKEIESGFFDGCSFWGLKKGLDGKIKYYEESFGFFRWLRGETKFSLLGSNFSIHRKDILKVNGFDEDYESRGGGEDTDIAYRLNLVGLKMRSVRYLAVQHHLGHPTGESKKYSAELFNEKIKNLDSIEDAKNINSLIRVEYEG